MRYLSKFLFLYILFVYFFCVPLYSTVRAQINTIFVSPTLIDAVVKPGKSITIPYLIQNQGESGTMKISLVPIEFRDKSNSVNPLFNQTPAIPYTINDESATISDPFLIQSKSSKKISVTLNVPQAIQYKDYYLGLTIELLPQPPTNGNVNSQIHPMIIPLIYLSISDTSYTTNSGKISQFTTLAPFFRFHLGDTIVDIFDSSDQIPILLSIVNFGKYRIKPKGSIIITSSIGQKQEYKIQDQYILADSEKTISIGSKEKQSCSSNNKRDICNQPYSLLLSQGKFGWYSITNAISFGNNTSILYGHTNFIALPLGLIFYTCLIVFFCIFFFLFFKFKVKKN
ncbi:MAG: hypothetical protein WCO06_01595 [Candidatus Roizmanbacteria bacterium]